MHSPVVVLGGGPGGYAAAFMAADLGLDVTLVEADRRLGGTCLLRGCIPSKALLHVARVVAETREMGEWGLEFGAPKLDLDRMRARKDQVIGTLTKGLGELAKRRNVRVINARGIFVDSQTLELENTGEEPLESQRLTFEHCILATGSRPAVPKAFDIPTDRVMDSTGALKLIDIPQTLLVVGGGYIGLEMGTVYAALGSKVTVVELTDGLLPGADRDLVKPLAKNFASKNTFGGGIQLNTKVTGLRDAGDHVDVD
ncbi:MAG: FAD-dependent oxidoreductase, partial [Planctomycetales bacterium]|nr:FAD-dependent oxidoreductase [Planctomycetales bacterium]